MIVYKVYYLPGVVVLEKIPYNYIGLLTFFNLLKYENLRSINKEDFDKYRDLLIERVKSEWKKLSFLPVEDDSFDDFLSEYSDIISYEDGILSLDSEVSLNELESRLSHLQKEEDIDDIFEVYDYQRQLLNILGFTSVYNVLKKYWNLEKKIEDIYMNLDREVDPNLKKYLLWRGIFLINFRNASSGVVDAIKNTSTSIGFEEDDYDYEDFPIDFSFWENPEYFSKSKDDLFDDVSDSLFYIYQYAIFGEESLGAQKLWKDIDYIYMNELESDDVEVDSCEDDFEDIDLSLFSEEELASIMNNDSDIIDPVFFLSYINKIDEFLLEYGNDPTLVKAKKRLIYVLDKPDICLYKDGNFKLALEESLEDFNNLEESNFDIFKDEARYMASEVFLSPSNKFTVRKLLFVSTYYELSGDEGIKDIVDSYSDRKEYDLYKKVIFGEPKSKKRI